MRTTKTEWVGLCTVLIAGVVFCPRTAPADLPATERVRQELEPFIEKQIDRQKIPGLAIGIILDAKQIYARGFGVQELGESVPVTEQTLFHQASITKPFVATAIMQLVERGEVRLEDPVTKHLDYFQVRGDGSEGITIRQLMNHTSGMPDVISYNWASPQYGDDELERHVRKLSFRTLRSPPGERFAYSNLGFEVLGDVVAKASGGSFETYLQEHILEPLAMQHSTLIVREANQDLVAAPHVKHKDGHIVVSKVYPYNRRHAPSSTLVSNVSDMTRWAIANLNRGTLDGNRILAEASYDQMWQTTAKVAGMRSMGLGWFLYEKDGRTLVLHGGSDLGFASLLVLAPEEKMAVILMANKHGANLRGIGEKAIAVALD